VDDGQPSWSPQGNRIAFVRTLANGRSAVYWMRSDGTGTTGLTNFRVFDSYPDWSPDARRIAFARFTVPTATTSSNVMTARSACSGG
jgi:Tol biopolymer transport system component